MNEIVYGDESFEDLLETFICGNFTRGVEIMQENNLHPKEFAEKFESFVDSMGYENLYDFNGGHFSPSFFIELGVSYYCDNHL